MIDEARADMADGGAGRHEIAPEMLGDEAADEIDKTVQNENPGEEKMPAPTGREILFARHRDPGRKGALRIFATLFRYAEYAGRVERMTEESS